MAYHKLLEFEWDDAKNNACFTERGFDFAYVSRAFADPGKQIVKDTRWDYGEDRYQMLACVDHRVFVVVYTQRGPCIRIISARKANRREKACYENNSHEN
jgi:uncharacterized DUF497 family protein